MSFLRLFLALLLAVGVFPVDANAGKHENLRTRLASAAGDFNSTMQDIDGTLEKLPEKVSTSKWENVKYGALEIKQKAEVLSSTLKQIETNISDLRIGEGRLAKRLDEMVRAFESLTSEAEADAAQLPEPLANLAKRERDTWRRGARIVRSFNDHYQSLLTDCDEQVSNLKLVQPILARIIRGADLYVELATVGEDLETGVAALQTLVDQFNAILDMFDLLAGQTEDAIAKSNPMTSPMFDTAFDEGLGSSNAGSGASGNLHPGPRSSISDPPIPVGSTQSQGVDGQSGSRPRSEDGSITHVAPDSSMMVAFTGIEANVGERFFAFRGRSQIGELVVQYHHNGRHVAVWKGDVSPRAGDLVRRDHFKLDT